MIIKKNTKDEKVTDINQLFSDIIENSFEEWISSNNKVENITPHFLEKILNYQLVSQTPLNIIGEITTEIEQVSLDYALVNVPDGYNHFQ